MGSSDDGNMKGRGIMVDEECRTIQVADPVWVTGDRKVSVEASKDAVRKATDAESGGVFAIIMIPVMAGLGVWFLHGAEGDGQLIAIGVILLSIAIGCAVFAFTSFNNKPNRDRAAHAIAAPNMTGVDTRLLHRHMMFEADSQDQDFDLVDYPMNTLIYRTDLPARTVTIPAYVDADEWERLTGVPDPQPDWKHRHLMAWLTITVDRERAAVTSITPIPVRQIRERWDKWDRNLPNPGNPVHDAGDWCGSVDPI